MKSSDRLFRHICKSLISISTGDDVKKLESILAENVKSKSCAATESIPQLNAITNVLKESISCQYCGKIFSQTSHRNHHQTGGYCKPKDKNHKPAQKLMALNDYQCPICGVITTKEKLRNHFRLSAKEKKYKPTKGGKMGRPEIHKQEPRTNFLLFLDDLKKNPKKYQVTQKVSRFFCLSFIFHLISTRKNHKCRQIAIKNDFFCFLFRLKRRLWMLLN